MKYALLFIYIFIVTLTYIAVALVINLLLALNSPPQAPPYSAMPLHMTNVHQITAQELQPTIQGTQLQ